LDPSTGVVTVPPGTPAGDYEITYQICEVLNPANCDTAVVQVPVSESPIQANDDPLPPTNGRDGGTVPGTVHDNDSLNGTPVDPSDITTTVVTPATPAEPGKPVPELDPSTGVVTVPPGTPAGEYEITYQICEIPDAPKSDLPAREKPVCERPLETND